MTAAGMPWLSKSNQKSGGRCGGFFTAVKAVWSSESVRAPSASPKTHNLPHTAERHAFYALVRVCMLGGMQNQKVTIESSFRITLLTSARRSKPRRSLSRSFGTRLRGHQGRTRTDAARALTEERQAGSMGPGRTLQVNMKKPMYEAVLLIHSVFLPQSKRNSRISGSTT